MQVNKGTASMGGWCPAKDFFFKIRAAKTPVWPIIAQPQGWAWPPQCKKWASLATARARVCITPGRPGSKPARRGGFKNVTFFVEMHFVA
jgi:hypothetical protein